MAEKAWQLFQMIESQGGIFAAASQDMLKSWAADAVKARQVRVDQGRDELLGVTLHPLREASAIPTCVVGRSGVRGGSCRPSAPWEELRVKFQKTKPRCLMLDVGTANPSSGLANRWFNAVGVDGAVMNAQNLDEARKIITSAKPDVLVFGGDKPDDTAAIMIDAGQFSPGQESDIQAVLEDIDTALKKKSSGGQK
jgi:hypothetical protein